MKPASAATTAAIAAAVVLAANGAAALEIRIQAVQAPDVRTMDTRVDQLIARGGLKTKYDREDALMEGRRHERFTQVYKGVPVWGAEVTRQRGAGGTISIFGSLYENIADLEVQPRVSGDRARDIAGDRVGASAPARLAPELLVFPADDGSFALAWRVVVFEGSHVWVVFIDAHTGRELHRYDDYQTQTATAGLGTGTAGDRKKLSVTFQDGTYYTADGLRPPLIITYDGRGEVFTGIRLANGGFGPGLTDAASDPDNDWTTNGAAVDAHTYAGWTYDYYFKVHNRRGLDGADMPVRSIVNPARKEDFFRFVAQLGAFFINAGWNTGVQAVLYGVGAPVPINIGFGSQTWSDLSGSLDVVAHELTHGVTQFSSGLLYQNESGALNEAFSDIMSAAIQFHYRHKSANYVVADDVVVPGGFRSLVNPPAFGDPDHYSLRFTGTADRGGVHTNSGIPNHAYVLAVESGTNRVSGRRVDGVGAAQREKIEKAFFRAFTRMLTPRSNFSDARAATIQSARDLYGAGDASVRALTQAWDAVGVN